MNQKPFFRIIVVSVCFLLVGGLFTEIYAQCPMCRMAAESNLANGGSEGKGLNKGILYMLAVPYLMVMTVGVIWYRNNKLVKEQEMEELELEDQNF